MGNNEVQTPDLSDPIEEIVTGAKVQHHEFSRTSCSETNCDKFPYAEFTKGKHYVLSCSFLSKSIKAALSISSDGGGWSLKRA